MAHSTSRGFHRGIHDRFQAVSGKLFAREVIDALALSLHRQDSIDGPRVSVKSIVSVTDLEDHLNETGTCVSSDTIL